MPRGADLRERIAPQKWWKWHDEVVIGNALSAPICIKYSARIDWLFARTTNTISKVFIILIFEFFHEINTKSHRIRIHSSFAAQSYCLQIFVCRFYFTGFLPIFILSHSIVYLFREVFFFLRSIIFPLAIWTMSINSIDIYQFERKFFFSFFYLFEENLRHFPLFLIILWAFICHSLV